MLSELQQASLSAQEPSLATTEQKQLAAALVQQLRQSQLIADELQIKVAYVDAQQQYQFVNPHYEAWHQMPAAEIIGKTVEELMGETVYKMIQPQVEAALSGETIRYPLTQTFPDGQERHLLISYVPDFNDDHSQVLGFLVICQDKAYYQQFVQA
jgi:two-component system, sensor histidine kinase